MSYLSLFIIGTLYFNGLAHALCTCERVSIDLAISQSKNVFEGIVTAVAVDHITLATTRAYKGESSTKIQLASSNCPAVFSKDKTYIFFLNGPEIKSGCEPHFEPAIERERSEHLKKVFRLSSSPQRPANSSL